MYEWSEHHQKSTCSNQQASKNGFWRELFPQNQGSQHHGDDYAELIHRNNFGSLSNLQCLVIAQPGGAGGQTRQDQKQPASAADCQNTGLGAGDKHHTPGHCQNHEGPYGSGQRGIHAVNADLCQNGSQCGEHRRSQCQVIQKCV